MNTVYTLKYKIQSHECHMSHTVSAVEHANAQLKCATIFDESSIVRLEVQRLHGLFSAFSVV